jgi:hypothetical protein
MATHFLLPERQDSLLPRRPAFQAVGTRRVTFLPQAALRLPAVMEIRLFKPEISNA